MLNTLKISKNNCVISNEDVNKIKDFIDEVQETTQAMTFVNDLNIIRKEFENSYSKIEKENNSLKYQLGKNDDEIKYFKVKKEKIKGELQKFKDF